MAGITFHPTRLLTVAEEVDLEEIDEQDQEAAAEVAIEEKHEKFTIAKNTTTTDLISELARQGCKQKPQRNSSHVTVVTPRGKDCFSIYVGGKAHKTVTPGLRHKVEKFMNQSRGV